MSSFFQWLQMGGYAGYIWSAYGITAAVLGISTLLMKKRASRLHQKIIQDLKHESGPQT